MKKDIKNYLKNDFLVDICIEDEKSFWESIFDKEDEFLEMLKTIHPFKENTLLLSKVVMKYHKKNNSKTFDHIWKIREQFLKENLEKQEVLNTIIVDPTILKFIENL